MNFILGALLVLLIVLYINNYSLSRILSLIIYILFMVNLFLIILKLNINEATDYKSYMLFFQTIKDISFVELLQIDYFEPIFKIVTWILLKFSIDNTYFLIVLLTNLLFCIGFYKFFENKILSITSLYLYSNFSFFLIMSSNILRQTLVIALIIIIISNYKKHKFLIPFLPFIHLSSLPILLFLIVHKWVKIKYIIITLFISLIFFLTNINSFIFGKMAFISEYNNKYIFEYYGETGNRMDFFILTLMIILFSVFLYKFKYISHFIFKYTLITGIYFYLFGFQAFSERLAIYNWYLIIIFIPLLLKILKKENYYI
ncbi:EpsG family protein [Staphylococcus hominis]|uniref:EpsG family protein n=1 Tax=Staphylococcus hominis TaxID=1290 RepID=UPI00194F14D3|nr:EpsG family protein [Staphylococcus hominis]MCE4953105.1 EpsG family protein [Staphylococcus hominis]